MRGRTLDAGTRLDDIGRDGEGRHCVIGEAERHNNDAATVAVAEYDTIATVSPAEALWAVPSTSAGHDAVLSSLADQPALSGATRAGPGDADRLRCRDIPEDVSDQEVRRAFAHRGHTRWSEGPIRRRYQTVFRGFRPTLYHISFAHG